MSLSKRLLILYARSTWPACGSGTTRLRTNSPGRSWLAM
jgi:hypothetical protein